MKKHFSTCLACKAVYFVTLLAFPSLSSATISLSLNGEYGYWDTGIKDKARGQIFGGNFAYYNHRYFTGLRYQRGKFTESKSDAIINRKQAEWIIGYQVWPSTSLYGGLKVIQIDYQAGQEQANLAFDERITGVGFGFSTHQYLNPLWQGYTTIALNGLVTRFHEVNNRVNGQGINLSASAGLIYLLHKQLQINIGLNFQTFAIQYNDNKSNGSNSLLTLNTSLIYQF